MIEFFVVFLYFSPQLLISKILTNCDTTISPNPGDIIICDKLCNICEISCIDSTQCKLTTIYSGADTTIITCTGPNSCQELIGYIGYPLVNNYPTIYNINDFKKTQYNQFTMNCLGKNACVKSNIYIYGNYINGGIINANGDGFDHFKDSYLSVSLLMTNIFNLNCGQYNSNCGGNTKYICLSGQCLCNNIIKGNIDGCQGIQSFIISTKQPTFITQQPTIKPTVTSKEPTLLPTTKNEIVTTLFNNNTNYIENNTIIKGVKKELFKMIIIIGAGVAGGLMLFIALYMHFCNPLNKDSDKNGRGLGISNESHEETLKSLEKNMVVKVNTNETENNDVDNKNTPDNNDNTPQYATPMDDMDIDNKDTPGGDADNDKNVVNNNGERFID